MVASGLNNPRLLSFRGRTLYVAEAGIGGSGPCRANPEGGTECFGASGSITRIGRHARRILTGLPSIAGHDGSQALGAADVVPLRHGKLAISFGAGGTPSQRAIFPGVGRWLGTLTVASHRGATWRHHHIGILADLMAFESRHDPDHQGVDSDPTGFIRTHGHFVNVDSGGNDVLRVGGGRPTGVLAVFGNRNAPNPFPPGGTVPMQAVPTAVAKGPHGALFISQLTGFPFPQGAARIYRLVPGHAPTVWATGLTNVTDLAWFHGSLYAVQIADHGLLAPGIPRGSLIKVAGGSVHHTVAGNLVAPYGVALRRGAAYVSTCSVCKGAGAVLRIPLH